MPELDTYTQLLCSAPKGWPRKSLGTVATIVSGGTPSRAVTSFWNGAHCWATPGEITKLSSKHISTTQERITDAGLAASAATLLPPDSVMVTTRATIGAVALNSVPMATNQGLKSLVPHAATNAVYLFYLVKLITPELIRRASGSTFLEISSREFEHIEVPLPPLPEQRRIAQILDTLDRTIESTQRIIEKLQATHQGLLHDLLTRGLDEHGQLRDPERNPEQFKETELGKLPRAWEIGRVEDFGEVRLGRQRSPQHQSGRYTTPYLRVANVFDGWIDYSDVLEMDFTPSEKTVYGLLPGDILLNEGQSLNLVGRPAMYEGEPGKFCYQNTLVRFRCGRQLVPSYTLSTFKRYLDTGVFQTIAKQTTSIAHLGADRFAKLLIAVPPLREQKAAVSLLDAASKKIVGEQRRLDKLQALKRGLMDDLLTGRVRVPLSEAER